MTLFRPTPGAWFDHPILGRAFVARDCHKAPCGLNDWGFTGVSYPSGQRVFVVASSCVEAPPPHSSPRLAFSAGEELPADCEAQP